MQLCIDSHVCGAIEQDVRVWARRVGHLRLVGVSLSGDVLVKVAAWGGVKLLRERFGIEPCVVTGPSTDNQVGVDVITEQLGVSAFNAMTNGAALGDRVIEAIGVKAPQ